MPMHHAVWNFVPILLYYILLCLPIILALLSLYYCLRFLREARLLEDSPTSKIRSAAQGWVELSGLAEMLPTSPVVGKISKKPLAWYQYFIEFWQPVQTSEGPRNQYMSIEQHQGDDYFILNDGTGKCIVDPRGAEVVSIHRFVGYGYSTEPDQIYPWSFWLWLFGNPPQYRYTENQIMFNDPLHINGVFRTRSITDPFISHDQALLSYCQNKNLNTLNIISAYNKPKNEVFLISAKSYPRLNRIFRLKAVVFLIIFIALIYITAFKFYPWVHTLMFEFNQYQLKALKK